MKFWNLAVFSLLCGIYSNAFTIEFPPKEETVAPPLGLPAIPWPSDNPYSAKKAELGKLLYFDKRLSSDGTVSCASCHTVKAAFADRKNFSEGIFGHKGTRHSMTVINCAYHKRLFWDGRAKTLEEQAKGPLANPLEMTAAKDEHDAHLQCEQKIQAIEGYRKLFKEAFGTDEINVDRIAKAIATFERTVLSGNSAYDRYVAGDKKAMSPEAIAGLEIFKSKGCAVCHFGFNFTDGSFQNIGVGMDAPKPDLGRYDVTKNEKDIGAFKVPTLRDVSKSYPYMHDGSLSTLDDVIDYYDKGGIPNPHLHYLMTPLHLSIKEKKELKSFLEALDGTGWEHFKEPESLPK